MAKVTLTLGVLLVALGLVGFISTGSHAPTALIPAGLGILFLLFGAMASSSDPKRRMLWMHIAVTVALVLFLGTIPSDIAVFKLAHGATLTRPVAIEEKAAMSLMCLLYVLLAVRSFLNVRRERLAV